MEIEPRSQVTPEEENVVKFKRVVFEESELTDRQDTHTR